MEIKSHGEKIEFGTEDRKFDLEMWVRYSNRNAQKVDEKWKCTLKR